MIVLQPGFEAALGTPRDAFDCIMSLDGEVLREMDGRRTLRLGLGHKTYYLKAHTGVGWLEIIKNLLQLRLPVTGARNEWLGIERLRALGVPTLSLAAYGQRGRNPARRQSFVVTEALEGCVSLEDFCGDWRQQERPAGEQVRFKRALIRRIALIARTLHENGINHRDFYLCHFLLDISGGVPVHDPGQLRLYLIDLHRVQLRRRVPRRWLIKDLAALFFSAMDAGLGDRDLYRFMVAYRQRPLRELLQEEKAFWRAVSGRAGRMYRAFHGREPPEQSP